MSPVHPCRRTSAAIVPAAIAAALLAGCSIEAPARHDESKQVIKKLDTRPTFDSGSVMARIQKRGKLKVGTKLDQALFGLMTDGAVTGFDAEMAKLVARDLGLDPAKDIEYVESVSKNREVFLQSGKVDIIAATYVVTPQRQKVVDFAGPYYTAGTGILVPKTNKDIRSKDDLAGKKVCYVTGADSLRALRLHAPKARITGMDTNSQCADAVANAQFDAGAAGEPILLGIVSKNPDLKIVQPPMTTELYGIGLPKGQGEFKEFIDKTLENAVARGEWKSAYDRTIGAVKPTPPTMPAVGDFGKVERTGQ
ncbi:glutamate ABC transporter substrate-binding protein [Actinomadura sp. KC06]|uniref:glutamate ABC transporter substrate-binding protein n=1 Tax=Actinomadura sp. KC06 TaxID=2530369 RepID=UPI00104E8073|nr:glutamate ABC transporter substrate-binding protein [Actinomadura sp. KC06]TDD32729.1 glutamate ABC transporter substrate-binding protein [Actinomadura sp. KC06]